MSWPTRGINEVQVEAGAKLNGALLAAGLVDELLVYLAPSLLGDPARGMFDRAVPIAGLDQRVRLQMRSVVPVGEDWRIVARVLSGVLDVHRHRRIGRTDHRGTARVPAASG